MLRSDQSNKRKFNYGHFGIGGQYQILQIVMGFLQYTNEFPLKRFVIQKNSDLNH